MMTMMASSGNEGRDTRAETSPSAPQSPSSSSSSSSEEDDHHQPHHHHRPRHHRHHEQQQQQQQHRRHHRRREETPDEDVGDDGDEDDEDGDDPTGKAGAATFPGKEALRACRDVQHMIDINSDHLERLRAPSAMPCTTSTLTKQEIRTLEGKLIKLFSKQLATKAQLTSAQLEPVQSQMAAYPSLTQWLAVVGLSKESVEAVQERVPSLDALKDKTESELNRMLLPQPVPPPGATQRLEDLRRLSKALQHLRRYTDTLLHPSAASSRPGDDASSSAADLAKMEMYWDSWEGSSGTAGGVGTSGAGIVGGSPLHDDLLHQQSSSYLTTMASSSSSNCYGGSRSIPKADSAASSLSSGSSSAPPPSPGLTLSPPVQGVVSQWSAVPAAGAAALGEGCKSTPPPTTPPWTSLYHQQHHHHHHHHYNHNYQGQQQHHHQHQHQLQQQQQQLKGGGGGLPSTPPANRKHSTGIVRQVLPESSNNVHLHHLHHHLYSATTAARDAAEGPSQQQQQQHLQGYHPSSNGGMIMSQSMFTTSLSHSYSVSAPLTTTSVVNAAPLTSEVGAATSVHHRPLPPDLSGGPPPPRSSSSHSSRSSSGSVVSRRGGPLPPHISTGSGGDQAAAAGDGPLPPVVVDQGGGSSSDFCLVSPPPLPSPKSPPSIFDNPPASGDQLKLHQQQHLYNYNPQIYSRDATQYQPQSPAAMSSFSTSSMAAASSPALSAAGTTLPPTPGASIHIAQQHQMVSSAASSSSSSSSLQVPKSPRTPSIGHLIRHRFTKTFKPGKCEYCLEYMFNGLKCKECKFKCHRDCEQHVPPSCGLPEDLLVYYLNQIVKEGSPIMPMRIGPAGSAAASGGSAGAPNSGSASSTSSIGGSQFLMAASSAATGSGGAFTSSSSGGGGDGHAGGKGKLASSSGGMHHPHPHHRLHQPHHSHHPHHGHHHHQPHHHPHHIPAYPDSSSNTSSCNSSTPSSPAVVLVTSNPTPPHSASIHTKVSQFQFPDTLPRPQQQQSSSSSSSMPASAGIPQLPFLQQQPQQQHLQLQLQLHQQQLQQLGGMATGHQQQMGHSPQHHKAQSPNPIIDSIKSNDSDRTLSGSSGSVGTAYWGSQDSTNETSTWNSARQASISLREWDIPYEEIVVGEKIGSGRFSTVHQGNWHGDVAVKILNMETNEDEVTLEAFRKEVATFRNTRHENLILFMGACMNPPKLAIVTSLCKGNTLYTHLHLRKDKFSMNKIVIIAQQIAQGMGYLHHRGVVHKDLKTKNIFLENGRAIIADFGLVNVARRLCARHNRPDLIGPPCAAGERECMSIPKGWLCYLAPEIMRTLRVQSDDIGTGSGNGSEDLPFTKDSDVYAFGTVWFELLTGEWPWKQQPPETIIWLVGRGMKPSLANLQASRDVKDILVLCWKFKAENRPDFTHLNKCLEKIPKKRLARSPSHPVHLSRSAESVF